MTKNNAKAEHLPYKGEVSPGGGAGGTNADIRQWFPVVTVPRQQNPTYDAERLRADIGDDGVEAAGPTDNTGEWTIVSTRRSVRSKNLDSRSIVIWGVPVTVAVQVLFGLCLPQGVRTQSVELCWKSYGNLRFVFLSFRTGLSRDSYYDSVRQHCRKYGWRAVKSQGYDMRAEARTARTGADLRKPLLTFNPYQLLESDETSSEESSAQDSVSCTEEKVDIPIPPPRLRCKLKLGSLNIQGGLKDKIGELETVINSGRYDVVALQEVRKVSKLAVDGYKYFGSINNDGYGGVGFLVALNIAPLVRVLPRQYGNQLWIEIKGTAGHSNISICSAYMPQEKAPAEDRSAAWRALSSSACNIRAKGDEVVVMGYLNARLGASSSPAEQGLIGPHSRGTTSGNGKLMKSFLRTCGLVNVAGFSQPPNRKNRWFTRMDPVNHSVSMIDYILVSGLQQRNFSVNFGVANISLDTDHRLIYSTIRCTRKFPKRRSNRRVKRFLIEKLRRSQAGGCSDRISGRPTVTREAEVYQEEVQRVFRDYDPKKVEDGLPEGAERDVVVEDFIEKMNKALENSVGSKVVSKRFSRPWFDQELKEMIAKRRLAYNDFKDKKTMLHWKRFCKLRSACRKLVTIKKRRHWNGLVDSIKENSGINPKLMWSKIKRIIGGGNKKQECVAIRRPDGSLATSVEDRCEAWAAYRDVLGTPTVDPFFNENFKTATKDLVRAYSNLKVVSDPAKLDAAFTDAELVSALNKLKYYKAGGVDGVRNEALKEGGVNLRMNILKLFNWINKSEKVPQSWSRSLVTNLYKDGDESDPDNYRGISLISCLGKLYLSIWTERITKHLDSTLAQEQGGFRAGRSTVDQIFTFNEVLLRRRRAGSTTYCLFIDFRKAFDTVWHDGLWRQLWSQGIRGKAWRIIKSLYASLECAVLVDGEKSRFSKIHQGVRQGCPLSPILFSIYINGLVDRLRGLGVTVGGRELSSLLYADDIVLMADSPEALQSMIEIVSDYTAAW